MTTEAQSHTITPQKRAAALALVECCTVADAARKTGVARETVSRWQNDPDFRALVRGYQSEAFGEVARRLTKLASKAADALEAALDKPAARGGHVRVRAAEAVIGALLRVREVADIEERLNALEQATAQRGGGNAFN